MTSFLIKERAVLKITVSTVGQHDDTEDDHVVGYGREKNVPVECERGLHAVPKTFP